MDRVLGILRDFQHCGCTSVPVKYDHSVSSSQIETQATYEKIIQNNLKQNKLKSNKMKLSKIVKYCVK